MAMKEPGKHSQGGGRFQPRIRCQGLVPPETLGKRKKKIFFFFSFLSLEAIRLFPVAIRGVCCCRLDKMVIDTDR